MKVLTKAVERLPDTWLEIHKPGPIRLHPNDPVESATRVKFQSWKCPVLVAPSGEIRYNNYEGNWGEISHLNKLKQVYGLEKLKI
jgi:hypothetical protein